MACTHMICTHMMSKYKKKGIRYWGFYSLLNVIKLFRFDANKNINVFQSTERMH